MALKIDKEALVEYATKNKDSLFVGLLAVILVLGGWFLYQQSAVSVDEIVQENMADSAGGGGEGGAAKTQDLVSSDILKEILEKRSSEMYNVNRNPFGSPEDQLRTRQQVQDAYEKGVQLYNAGQFDAAAQQFDRVIALDVTETRIQYPTLPSEYKRKAQQENAKKNFDSIFKSAQTDLAEGDRLVGTDKRGALAVYRRANDNLLTVIQSDPNGDVIGKQNFQNIQTLQQTAQKKLYDLAGSMLTEDLNRELTQAQSAVSGQDYLAMNRALGQLNRVKLELQSLDPNATLVNKAQHTRVAQMMESLQNKLKENFPLLVNQSDQAFVQAMATQDLQKSQEAITALGQALAINPSDQSLQKKISDYATQRANLVLQQAETFYNQQNAFLTQNQLEKFDRKGVAQYTKELLQLKELGAALDSATRNKIAALQANMAKLRLPPLLTETYNIISVTASANNVYNVELVDKTGRLKGNQKIIFREGRRDRNTGITLKQVDTTNGFVILSKSGYQDTKVPITK